MVNKIGNPRVDYLLDKKADKIRSMETEALKRADSLQQNLKDFDILYCHWRKIINGDTR